VDSFLDAAFATDLSNFPLPDQYVADTIEDRLVPD